MKIAIIGCGLIGEKRAKVLGEHELIMTADPDISKAEKLCKLRNQGKAVKDWNEVMDSDAEIVIISTTNDWLTNIGIKALESGKHVLVEKPAARSVEEIELFLNAEKKSKKKVKIGFNLRYHPSFIKAKQIVSSNEIGDLMFIRGRYGHGGRIGYDKEWRADPLKSGGGELIDQGVHLIDLSRWFLGDFTDIKGFAHTYFWDMPVDDNGFAALRTLKDQMAWLHVSCSEWKNMFCFEIYGKYGKLQIDGLGGSYGIEKLSYYKMLPEMGPPETTIWEYPGEDKSWKNEFDDFIKNIENNTPVNGGLNDAYHSLNIVNEIYRSKKK